MKKTFFSALFCVAASFSAQAQIGGATTSTTTASTPLSFYATAKSIAVPLRSDTTWVLILDDGIKRTLKSPYLEDEQGKVLNFENESKVINYLSDKGWDVLPSGTEPSPYGTFNRYTLKRRDAASQ